MKERAEILIKEIDQKIEELTKKEKQEELDKLLTEIDKKIEKLENTSKEELQKKQEEKLNIIKEFSEKTNHLDLYEKCSKMGEPIITIVYNDIKHKLSE